MVPDPIITSASPAHPPAPARTVTVSVADLDTLCDSLDRVATNLIDGQPHHLRSAAFGLGFILAQMRKLRPQPAAAS